MSRPIFAVLEHESTNDALARLGFRHQGRVGLGGNVMRISDGHIMHYSKDVWATNRWIEAGCPDCDGKAMPEEDDAPSHTASDFEVAS